MLLHTGSSIFLTHNIQYFHIWLVVTPRNFFRVFLNKYKLHDLIKRKFFIYWQQQQSKNTQIHKIYNFLLRVFIFWNRYIIVSLSMLQATSFSIYTTKQSFINWSPIRLRSSFFIYFIAEKLLSIVAVVTKIVKTNFTSK